MEKKCYIIANHPDGRRYAHLVWLHKPVAGYSAISIDGTRFESGFFGDISHRFRYWINVMCRNAKAQGYEVRKEFK